MINLEMDFTFDNLLITDVKIWNCSMRRFRNIEVLFDTGARISAIDAVSFRNLGYDFSDARDMFVTTASNNRLSTKRAMIHDLMLGDFEIGPFVVDVIDFPIAHFQMILGLDIIKEFKNVLNFEEQTFQMSPRYSTGKISFENFDYNSSRYGDGQLSNIINLLNREK